MRGARRVRVGLVREGQVRVASYSVLLAVIGKRDAFGDLAPGPTKVACPNPQDEVAAGALLRAADLRSLEARQLVFKLALRRAQRDGVRVEARDAPFAAGPRDERRGQRCWRTSRNKRGLGDREQ